MNRRGVQLLAVCAWLAAAPAAPAVAPLIAVGGVAAAGLVIYDSAQAVATAMGVSGPRPDDPRSLEEAAAVVRDMRASGRSNDEISRYLSEMIDRRLQAENRGWTSAGEGYISAWDRYGNTERYQRYLRWIQERDAGRPGEVEPDECRRVAMLAWETRFGNCNESAMVAQSVLQMAGVEARILESSAGHNFVVIGLAPGADPNDPRTWGTDARVVDGWTGHSLTPEEAMGSKWHSAGGKAVMADVTGRFVNPAQTRRWEALTGRGGSSPAAVHPPVVQGGPGSPPAGGAGPPGPPRPHPNMGAGGGPSPDAGPSAAAERPVVDPNVITP